MPELHADTLATVAAGRAALVDRLRALAARVEQLHAAAEVLVLLEPLPAHAWPRKPVSVPYGTPGVVGLSTCTVVRLDQATGREYGH
jgi:hypothetical protein